MSKQVDYHTLNDELEQILSELQADDIDVDTATKKYERGLQLIHELETYLKTAENTVTKLARPGTE